ncbi:hypothetical protein SNOG_05423 [Parastagonospora nodorum SN15]|uniref:Uncharacterized protein n=1 Tax=Phaeosphaeria nodorum (strain SN15 / ATCC MYA-4574 / FGSC 10173) TaxID=321614 RepID=Q0US41_PHANO|nr:hypothetical protein SNOG_05423 [Parastagonospora nodorum SN15]EAT87814.1 hypothetical protein SNOG_05423 [Parastagonospora nodorum SN15]
MASSTELNGFLTSWYDKLRSMQKLAMPVHETTLPSQLKPHPDGHQQWSGSTWSKQVYTTVEDCLRTWIKEVKDRWDA